MENKWYKECERLSNEIDKLKKDNNRLKARLKGYDTGLTPTQRKKYEDMVKDNKLTNEAYNDVCDERDRLRSERKDYQRWFKEELKRRTNIWKSKSSKRIIQGSWDGILESLLGIKFPKEEEGK